MSMLSALYWEIKENEIKMEADDLHHGNAVAFLGNDKEGWLKKKGNTGTQRRWFLLMDNNLYYFNKAEDIQGEKPRAWYPLENVVVEERGRFAIGRVPSISLSSLIVWSLLPSCRQEGSDVLRHPRRQR